MPGHTAGEFGHNDFYPVPPSSLAAWPPLIRLINRWLESKYSGISGTGLVDALLNEELDSFTKGFKVFFHEAVSYFDTQHTEPEKFYHAFMLGMLQHVKGSYVVLSQKESGLGRYD